MMMIARTRLFNLHQRLLPRATLSVFETNRVVVNHGPSSSASQFDRNNGVGGGGGGILRPTRRGIITRSAPPSPDVFIERPEIMVLAESSFYKNPWTEYASTFWPSMGMHFASIDIMNANNNISSKLEKGLHTGNNQSATTTSTTLKSLQTTLAGDMSRLNEIGDIGDIDLYIPGEAPDVSTSAYAVLIARGPIQCLVAQYFLESMPLAGLVLIDPLILPEDGRSRKKQAESEGGENRWNASLSDMISMLENKTPSMYQHAPQPSINESNHPPILFPSSGSIDKPAASELESSLLHSLRATGQKSRPLKMEAGSVPVLVMYSGDHAYHDYYRICAERTAAFHTCGGRGDYFDQVSVLKIQQKNMGSNESPMMTDDLDEMMKNIYEWYDEVVA